MDQRSVPGAGRGVSKVPIVPCCQVCSCAEPEGLRLKSHSAEDQKSRVVQAGTELTESSCSATFVLPKWQGSPVLTTEDSASFHWGRQCCVGKALGLSPNTTEGKDEIYITPVLGMTAPKSGAV